MRAIFSLVLSLVGVFIVLVMVTAMVSFIRHTWFGSHSSGSNHVRVIDVSGVILSPSALLEELDDYTENKHTKAIVLRVNSPGGLVAPSQELYNAFRKVDEKIPVIVSMSSVAASGGYYIALGGRKIFANPGTLTGSIGVIMEFVNTQKLYQWAKMDRFSITSGKFKDAGSPLRPMSAEDKALFQAMVKDIYAQFRGTVKERRKISDDALDKITDGRVLTGSQALEAKLVDSFGGVEEAIKEAKAIAKLPEDATVVYPEKHHGLLRRLLVGEEEDSSSRLWDFVFQAASNALPDPLPGPAWRVLWLAPVR